MKITDTHCHLYVEEFDADRDQAVQRAIDAGVNRMILPNIDCASVAAMNKLAETYPQHFRMAMGLHPSEVTDNWTKDLNFILSELNAHPDKYIAVGEIGIDLYWDKSREREQMLAFDKQVSVAEELGKPLIIHCREGLDNVLEVLGGHKEARAVFHCFTGSEHDVERIRRVGDYYFGIGGVVTFKKSSLPAVLPAIGIERILLETDCPYLAPVPWRGRRNESSFIVSVAKTVASVMGIDTETAAEQTAANSVELFGF